MIAPLPPGLAVHVAADEAATVAALAERVVAEIAAAIGARGRCRLALAGGSTPRPLYDRLAAGLGGPVDWAAVEIFFGDERCVPPEDPASNYRMAREALLDRVAVPEAQIHRIEGERPPEEAAAAYAGRLGLAPLDVVLLGLGEDGHTASLFPGTPGLRQETRPVVVTVSPAPPAARISLSLRALCAARCALFLATGARKAAPFARVAAEAAREAAGGAPADLPAAMVRPAGGAPGFYLDAAAARESPWRIP